MDTMEHIEITQETEIESGENTKPATIKTFELVDIGKTFSAEFLSEPMCRQVILSALHPEGPYCPCCGMKITDDITVSNFWNLRRCKCKACGKWFSATVGTILHGSQLNMQQVYALAILFVLGHNNKQIADIIGIHPDSVRLWRMRFETK